MTWTRKIRLTWTWPHWLISCSSRGAERVGASSVAFWGPSGRSTWPHPPHRSAGPISSLPPLESRRQMSGVFVQRGVAGVMSRHPQAQPISLERKQLTNCKIRLKFQFNPVGEQLEHFVQTTSRNWGRGKPQQHLYFGKSLINTCLFLLYIYIQLFLPSSQHVEILIYSCQSKSGTKLHFIVLRPKISLCLHPWPTIRYLINI